MARLPPSFIGSTVALVGLMVSASCSTSSQGEPADASIPEASETDTVVASDGMSDGGGSPDAEADACAPIAVDASLVDGRIVGLPTANVVAAPAIVTPQVTATPPSLHYPKQVAVLNLSPSIQDAQSVVHMLAPMGIPHAITSSPVLAVQHDMAIFFPEASGASFDTTALGLLDEYVKGGGVVVMKYSEVDALKKLGGVLSSTFHLEHHAVDLTAAGRARFVSLDRPEEQRIPLGGDPGGYLNTWAIDVDPQASGTSVLATFDDARPAIVERQVGKGVVYTVGVDWRDVILRNQLGRSLNAARGYINVFEPATDSWMLMLRDLYDTHVRFGVRVHTAPSGLRAAVLLSHDLDWGASYDRAIQFAKDEADVGASATFFLHAKYVSDDQDTAFFGAEREAQLETLFGMGGRIGSHTVAHSPVLHTFPIGDGTEAYPAYAPYNASSSTRDATLFGEMRVSKSLIEGALRARCVPLHVATFRAGNLEYHSAAPQTLERLGYRFDSTRAVGDVLGSFPYRAMTDWPDALDTSIFEFPVTIEDQKAPRFDVRVPDTLSIVAANADNGAPTTVLVHPNVLDYKENGLKALLSGLPSGVTAMSVDAFGAFWRARDAVRFSQINYDDVAKTLTVSMTTVEAVDGLTLRVAPNVDHVVSPAQASMVQGPNGNFVVLPSLSAGAALTLTLGYM